MRGTGRCLFFENSKYQVAGTYKHLLFQHSNVKYRNTWYKANKLFHYVKKYRAELKAAMKPIIVIYDIY